MEKKNYDFERFVELMARMILKYADKVDISNIEIPEENEREAA